MLVVAGPNGSGKSSVVTASGIAKSYGDNIINPDNYAKNITDIEDNTERYIFAMRNCEILRESLLEAKVSFGFETVASTKEKIEFVEKAVANGYKVDLVYVSLENPELCFQRVQKRVEKGGHDVERAKIFSRYERSMSFLKDYIRVADTAYVYDNSGRSPVLVFRKDFGKIEIIKDPSKLQWVDRHIYFYYKNAERTLDINR